jgi:glycosyltransferase involved in cell wall biosynthesis
MKILCVIASLDCGGAQRQLVNIACGLKKRGHVVEFLNYYPQNFFKPQLDQANIPVHLFSKTSRFSIAPILALRRLLRHKAFNAVLAFLETEIVYAEIACLGIPGVRLVVSERSSVRESRMTPGRSAKSRLHLRADAVVTNSYAHREWMAVRFPYLKTRLHTIWNGIDSAVFHPAGRSTRSTQLRLLGLGRISPAKNLIALAQALGDCLRQGLPVTLDWAGWSDDAPYHQQVLRAIEDHKVGKKWSWLGVREDIPTLLHQYDALILPSLWEGLPNVACEALAAGLPVLASDVSDNARLVQHGVTGFIFDPKQPYAIALAISRFAALDQDTRARIGRAARSFAERELSLATCITAYERLLVENRENCLPALS